MITRHASCDAELFCANSNGTGFHNVGPDITRHNWVEASFSRRTAGGLWVRAHDDGTPYGWQYEDDGIEYPIIQAYVDSGGTALYTWEGETPADIDIENNISSTDPMGRALTGGTMTNVQIPSGSALTTIESSVSAASSPTWIVGTQYADRSNDDLLIDLWLKKLAGRRLKPYGDIDTVQAVDLTLTMMNLYILLWLRSASQIIYNHAGETCIPLVKDAFSIDTTYGYVTV